MGTGVVQDDAVQGLQLCCSAIGLHAAGWPQHILPPSCRLHVASCSLPSFPPRARPLCSYTARVELSSKVLDCFSKLERTLCHELCHVAAWLVNHTAKPPHGPVFCAWAGKAMALYSHLDITTCHAYEIFYPFRWGGCRGREWVVWQQEPNVVTPLWVMSRDAVPRLPPHLSSP